MYRKQMTPRAGGFGLYIVTVLFVTALCVIGLFYPQFFRMRSGIYKISCKEIRRKVEVAVENYAVNNTRSLVQPGKNIDLDMLNGTGFLGEVQYCPEGGKLQYGPQGEVLCTVHRPRVEVTREAEPAGSEKKEGK
ncbi:MAG TPA: hypothetical protein PKO06_11925 [Candidatus Ozemobacteraceae bacterium]|nr:hypothetical protein [Candidatus Ozemobacteraceae bacterium]